MFDRKYFLVINFLVAITLGEKFREDLRKLIVKGSISEDFYDYNTYCIFEL